MVKEQGGKRVYFWGLYVNYGYGWEYETAEDSYKEIKTRQREYKENCPQYSTKVCRKWEYREN